MILEGDKTLSEERQNKASAKTLEKSLSASFTAFAEIKVWWKVQLASVIGMKISSFLVQYCEQLRTEGHDTHLESKVV